MRENAQHIIGDICFRPMKLEDIPQVTAIDKRSFPTPWSETTYRKELTGNPAAHLFVAETRSGDRSQGTIIGYIGFWYIVDEIHISTLAVRPELRRRGIGKLILDSALNEACTMGAGLATLEVRESNRGAIALYRKFGFEERSRYPGYYRDTNEDALVMHKQRLDLHQLEVKEMVRECR